MRSFAPPLGPLCAAPDCDRERGRRRYCEGHRRRLRLGLPLTPLLGPHGKLPGRMCYAGCGRRRNRPGRWCAACASRWQRRKRALLRKRAASA